MFNIFMSFNYVINGKRRLFIQPLGIFKTQISDHAQGADACAQNHYHGHKIAFATVTAKMDKLSFIFVGKLPSRFFFVLPAANRALADKF